MAAKAEWRLIIMKPQKTATPKKAKRSIGSIVTYTAGSITAIIAIASLVNNIILYKSNVAQYVAQGYTASEVTKQLLPAQLLPGVFESIAVYGGIAFLIFIAGRIHQKVFQCLDLLTTREVESSCDAAAESNMEEDEGIEKEIEDIPLAQATEQVSEDYDKKFV